MPGFPRKNWDLFSLASHALRCVRLARFARARLLGHAFPISLLILRKKNPTVLQSIVLLSNFFLKLGIINIHNMNFKKMKKKAMKKLGSPCLFTRRKALKLGYFHWFALKIQIAFIQN